MKYDCVLGNPPYQAYNENGTKIPVYQKFIKKALESLKPGGLAAMYVPSVSVANPEGRGMKALQQGRILDVYTGYQQDFGVGTHISGIYFQNAKWTDTHRVNGRTIDRSKLTMLPFDCSEPIISIFEKIQAFEPVHPHWRLKTWNEFAKLVEGKSIIGISRMDRHKTYKANTFEELNERNLKKVSIYWVEEDNPEALKRLLTCKVMSVLCRKTIYTSNVPRGALECVTAPQGWQDLQTDEDYYKAYKLTKEEIDYVEELHQTRKR